MINVSPRFLATLTGPHRVAVSADVLRSGVVVASGVPVASGSIVASRLQGVRRTCDVMVGDPSYRPRSPLDPLAPYGQELRLSMGVTYPEGDVETVPVGVFEIRQADDDWPFQGVKIKGSSREAWVVDDRFLTPRVAEGPSQTDAVQTLLAESVPWAAFVDACSTDSALPRVVWARDRWQAISGMAVALGAEVYADAHGAFVLADVPDPGQDPVWTVAAGTGGAMVSVARALSIEGMYNAVIADGGTSGTAIPVVGDPQTDNDPLSPTRYGYPLKRPTYYSSPLLTTVEQCNQAAASMLLDTLGLAKSVKLVAAVNYALEPGDVITVVYPDGLAENHIVDEIRLSWGAAASMELTTRTTTYRLTTRPNRARNTRGLY